MAKIFFSLHKKEKKKEKENARENPENILLAHNPHYCKGTFMNHIITGETRFKLALYFQVTRRHKLLTAS